MKACKPLQWHINRLQDTSINGVARQACNRRSPSKQHASRLQQAAANLQWWAVAAALGKEGCSRRATTVSHGRQQLQIKPSGNLTGCMRHGCNSSPWWRRLWRWRTACGHSTVSGNNILRC